MSRGRRDRYEIIADILKSARDGEVKTKIMLHAQLSHRQLEAFLPRLMKEDLLEYSELRERRRTRHVLKTTEKGKHFVENFEVLRKLEQVFNSNSLH